MISQELKDEMVRDMMEEARRDEDYENRMRTDWEFALEQLDNKDCPLDNAIDVIKGISKALNELGYVTSPQELLDLN